MTDDYISQLLPLVLLIVACEAVLVCVVVSQARHFVLPFCEGFSMTLAQGLTAISLMCNCVVPNDDWTSLGLSLHSLIILTGCVSIDLGLKESYICLWVLGCVFPCFLSHEHELHIQNTFTSTRTTNSASYITIPNCETTSGNLASGSFQA